MLLPVIILYFGYESFQQLVPNGRVNGKDTGHRVNNPTHTAFRFAFRDEGRAWTTALCLADTDSDGQSNGMELGDPCCVWSVGVDEGELLGFSTNDISLAGDEASRTSRSMPLCAPPPLAVGTPPSSPRSSPESSPSSSTSSPSLSLPIAPLLAHGVLMSIAWGLLLPSGAFLSLTWRSRLVDGRWLRMHCAVQGGGLAVAAAGVALAVAWVPRGRHFSHTHHTLGIVAFVLALLQPLNALMRGRIRTTRRAAWQVAHKGVGYAVLGVGVHQAFSGRLLMPSQGGTVFVVYVVLLGLSFGVLAGGLGVARAGCLGA